MAEQPTGTVTLLFTDIEGSTRLLERLGRDRYADALDLHCRLLREAFERHGGYEVDYEGDSFFIAFSRAEDAVGAAAEAQQALARAEWPEVLEFRVRMGIHTGEPLAVPPKYVGMDVHKAARIMAAGHGGQVLLSESTRALLDSTFALRDLGEHRLKDLSGPQRLYQLGEDEFPPLKSLNQTNLPVQPTPLIGRERELREVIALVGSHRLVTLTGAGGSGKTRLALQAAAELADTFPDGVWFVSLAAITDASLIEPSIAAVVRAKDDLESFIHGKQLILVLDNLEQLLPEAAAVVARAQATVLATSRERLNVYGEQEYPVPTLPIAEAVELFTQRARQLKPTFQADEHVNEIVRRLDGLPLAVELAAARIKVLTTRQIRDRLDHSLDVLTTGASDLPARQRTLRATIEWSFELLTEEEQRLFTTLGVFNGSFDLDSAEAVAAATIDTLGSLVDKSLLRETSAGRFFMLETIREYALERLDSADEYVARRRHAECFHRLVMEAGPALRGAEQVVWLERLEAEHHNIRATLTFARDADDSEQLLELVTGLARFWSVRAHWHEGASWLGTTLAVSRAEGTPLYARALEAAADIAWRQGRYDEGRSLLDESIVLWNELGDRRGALGTIHFRGNLEGSAGNYEQAKSLWEEAQAGWIELGDHERYVATVYNLSLATYAESGPREAAVQLEDSLALARAEGLEVLASLSLLSLGLTRLDLKRLEDAASMLTEALAALNGLGHQEAVAICLIGLAELAQLEDRWCRGARLLGAAEALAHGIGFSFQVQLRERHARVAETLRSGLGPTLFATTSSEGQALDQERAVEYALSAGD